MSQRFILCDAFFIFRAMHIRYTLLFFAFFIYFQLNAQKIEIDYLSGSWQHSVEEQNGDTLVFRPEGYVLPRVRGRELFEFCKNGKFVYHQIAPTDGFLKLPGSYTLKDDTKELVITYKKGNENKVSTYSIITLSPKMLKLILIQENK